MKVSSTPVRAKAGKDKQGFLSRHNRARWLVVVAMFLIAVLIRMAYLDHSVTEFYPDRQYFSAWGARIMYYSSLHSIPGWQENAIEGYSDYIRITNQVDRSRMTVPLPTIESIACLLYRLAGGEHMWLPRAFSALAWVVGGVFLYLLAKRLMTIEAALLATGFYLFLPAAIYGSRSFQDEPLMIAAMICSLYAVFLHHEKPTLRRALAAAAVAAVAVLIRPLCAFMIAGAFIALSLKRKGFRRTVMDPHSWLIGGMTVLPTAVLIIVDRFVLAAGGIESQERLLAPQMLLHLSSYFAWAFYVFGVIGSWGSELWVVAGPITLAAAVIGAVMLRKSDARVLVAGLWCGYVALCMTFIALVANHHYHNLLIIPLIALCLGPITVRILRLAYNSLVDIARSRWVARSLIGGILFVFVTFQILVTMASALTAEETGRQLEIDAQTIGELVNHSTRVLVLSYGRGNDVTYEGWFQGRPWPRWEDQRSLQTADIVSVEEMFHNTYEDWQPTFFVITDLSELDGQPALAQFLFSTYPAVAQTDTYLVFDLREPLPSHGDAP